jgi:hypothetical protein
MPDPIRSGGEVPAGTYQCTFCGRRLHVERRLPPCPSCRNDEYRTLAADEPQVDLALRWKW